MSLLRHGRVATEVGEANTYGDLGIYKRADDLDPLIHRLFGERVEGNVLIAPHLSVPAKREAA